MPCAAVHPRSSVLQALGSAHGRLITGDFRDSRPPRRPDSGRSASVAYEFVHFGLGNREPETFRGARSLDARRDNPRARPRGSARHSAAPPCWPTPRDLRECNPLSQKRVRVAQNANAPAVRPGRSLLTCSRASFARARQTHAAFGRWWEVGRAGRVSKDLRDLARRRELDSPSWRAQNRVLDLSSSPAPCPSA
jgi:hypothetical protein